MEGFEPKIRKIFKQVALSNKKEIKTLLCE